MENKDLCEHTRIRLIAAAVGHQQCTKMESTLIPLPGTKRFIAIGTLHAIAEVLMVEPPSWEEAALQTDEQILETYHYQLSIDGGDVEKAVINAVRVLALANATQAARDVLAERRRQVEAEGMTNDGDDRYQAAELPRAAASYILNGANDEAPCIWPWAKSWWKPRDARANYVRAAALLLAEIERIDRAQEGGHHD